MAFHPTDPELREALIEHRTAHGLTNHAMGKLFGVSATFISKYLNSKLDHPPGDFEAKARDMITALRARLELATELFDTTVSSAIAGRIDMARRTADVALIVGASGEGKSCGARLYVNKHPGTLYIEIATYQRTDKKVAAALFDKLERRQDWKGNIGRAEFITRQLVGSHRVIIVDEAHLLDATGRQLLFNLNRDTGCAVIMIGNPEILDKIRRNEQLSTRIGVKGEPELTKKEIPVVAARIANQFSSEEFGEEIADLAAFTATKAGRLRAVRKTVTLAYELHLKNGTSPRESFRLAHKELVRDYALPGD